MHSCNETTIHSLLHPHQLYMHQTQSIDYKKCSVVHHPTLQYASVIYNSSPACINTKSEQVTMAVVESDTQYYFFSVSSFISARLACGGSFSLFCPPTEPKLFLPEPCNGIRTVTNQQGSSTTSKRSLTPYTPCSLLVKYHSRSTVICCTTWQKHLGLRILAKLSRLYKNLQI